MESVKFGKLATIRTDGSVRVCVYIPDEPGRIASTVRVQTFGKDDNSPAYLDKPSTDCPYCNGNETHTWNAHEKEKIMWKTKVFTTKAAMDKFIEKNAGKIQYNQVFINNGYGIEYRKLRRVY